MFIDIIVNQPGTQLPPLGSGQMRYVVAENGVFLERRTDLYTTCCPVRSSIAGLEPHAKSCELHLPQLPERLTREMLSFFRWCHQLHEGEAALLLLYNTANRELQWHCPEQRVELEETWWSTWRNVYEIEYESPDELAEGWVVLADAHSHGHLTAYASATDKEDERYKDGLHIVAGCVDRDVVDLHVDFVMDGTRFEVDPQIVFGGLEAKATQFDGKRYCVSQEASADETSIDATTETFPELWRDKVTIDRKPYPYYFWSRPYESELGGQSEQSGQSGQTYG